MTAEDLTQQHQNGEQTSTDSSAGNNQNEGDHSSQGQPQGDASDFSNIPLDKHPRWQERERDWNKRFEDQEKTVGDRIKTAVAEALKGVQPPAPQNQEDEIPEWFGGDLKQWRAYKAHQQTLLKEHEDRAYERFNSDKQQQEARVAEANKWFEDSVAQIETANPGTKVDRNALLAFVLEKQLIDPQGRWNYALGYEYMTALQGATKDKGNQGLTDRRRLADTTVQDSGHGGRVDDKNVASSETFRDPSKRPW